MNLADLIEKRRFVGREFLVWLWFESELCEGRFEAPSFGAFELWLDSQMTLVQDKEQSRLKGAMPSSAPEAHEALRQGKLPTQARVRVARGELEFAFTLSADTLGLTSMKIPQVVKEAGDEQFYERMYLVEDIECLFGALYAQFVALRLSTAWASDVAPLIRAWVRGDAVLDAEGYRRAVRTVAPLGRVARPRTTPPPAGEATATRDQRVA